MCRRLASPTADRPIKFVDLRKTSVRNRLIASALATLSVTSSVLGLGTRVTHHRRFALSLQMLRERSISHCQGFDLLPFACLLSSTAVNSVPRLRDLGAEHDGDIHARSNGCLGGHFDAVWRFCGGKPSQGFAFQAARELAGSEDGRGAGGAQGRRARGPEWRGRGRRRVAEQLSGRAVLRRDRNRVASADFHCDF